MSKTIRSHIAQEKEKYRVPKSVQDTIPIKKFWSDGIFLVGNKYSKTFKFTDINFQMASAEDKRGMMEHYAELINSLDPAATTKITINSRRVLQSEIRDNILLPDIDDELKIYRDELNDFLKMRAAGSGGFQQEKYITVSVSKRNVDEARAYFSRIESMLSAKLKALGSKCVPLDDNQRLRILHNFYRDGEDDHFFYDPKLVYRKGHNVKDYICPDYIEKNNDYLKLGDTFCRVMYLKDYASQIADDFIQYLFEQAKDLVLSIDAIPIPAEEAIKDAEARLLAVETNITNWQRRQNNNNNFSAEVPLNLANERAEARAFLDDLTMRDQRMLSAVVTIAVRAKSKEQLDRDTEAIKSAALGRMSQITTLTFQQMDGLNTVLPLGVRKIDAFRTLNTESLSILVPFKAQDVQERGGIYIGQNAITNNMILCNRELLLNQSGFLLGVPGGGKSFFAKLLAMMTFLSTTTDQILIADPEGEYAFIAEALGEKYATVVHMEAGGKDRLNPMEITEGYGDGNPVVVKSTLVMSLLEQIDKFGIGPQQKSIIDRCVAKVLKNAKKGETPTLSSVRDMILKQPEPIAQDIALAMELYTTGSLDIFGHESNVNLDKRMIVFDLHKLDRQLKPTATTIITDVMLNRVQENWKAGVRTHLFMDEFHVMLETESGAEFFTSAWRMFRKRNAWPIAITQNVSYMLSSVHGCTMLSNSEFVVMLSQAAADRNQLADLLNISDNQMGYVTNVEPGAGLLKYGANLIPFKNRFPHNTRIYNLLTTRPGEGAFHGGQV